MSEFNKDTHKHLQIKLDVSELNQQQIRLLKTLNTMIVQVMTAPDEAEYFENSAEFLKLAASVVKQSNFAETNKGTGVAYADQALEYSLDTISETLQSAKIVTFDN